jgi:hypothetical protein
MSTQGEQQGEQWYWCMRHGTAEQGVGCRGSERLGPYPSAEAAAHWRETVERRNETWDEEDRRWRGDA